MRNIMKIKFVSSNLIKIALVFAFLFALNVTAEAQRRRTTRPKPKPAKITPATTAVTNAEIKTGAEKVSVQIKNLTKFIYVLGGVARSIEEIDKEMKTGKVSSEVQDQNAKFKQSVLQSLRNLRAGLVPIEVDFRAKPELRPYLPRVQGIADLSGRAEDLAVSGQYTESGKVLLLIVERLADTLAAMP
jgi:hypothetical protein